MVRKSKLIIWNSLYIWFVADVVVVVFVHVSYLLQFLTILEAKCFCCLSNEKKEIVCQCLLLTHFDYIDVRATLLSIYLSIILIYFFSVSHRLFAMSCCYLKKWFYFRYKQTVKTISWYFFSSSHGRDISFHIILI